MPMLNNANSAFFSIKLVHTIMPHLLTFFIFMGSMIPRPKGKLLDSIGSDNVVYLLHYMHHLLLLMVNNITVMLDTYVT